MFNDYVRKMLNISTACLSDRSDSQHEENCRLLIDLSITLSRKDLWPVYRSFTQRMQSINYRCVNTGFKQTRCEDKCGGYSILT